MAFKQTPGRSPFAKTGRGIPAPLLWLSKEQRELKRSMKELVKEGASQVTVVDGKATATEGGGTGLDRFSRRGIRQYVKGKDMKNTINTKKNVIGENKVTTTPIQHTSGDPGHTHKNITKTVGKWSPWENVGDPTEEFKKDDKGTTLTTSQKQTSSLPTEFTAEGDKIYEGKSLEERKIQDDKWREISNRKRTQTSSKFMPDVNLDVKPLKPQLLDVKPAELDMPDLQKITPTDKSTPKKDVVDLGRLEKPPETVKPPDTELGKPIKQKKDRGKIKRDRQKKRDTNKLERQTNRQNRRQSQGKCPPCNC